MAFGDGHTLVPDEGRRSARLVLVGESPGKREMSQRRPFVGPSGLRLREWWAEVGLQRGDFYITNVVPYMPPHGIDKLAPAEIQHWIGELHARLAALDDPWLIVPTGNYAMYALTRRGKISYDHESAGITAYRGTIMEARLRDGRTVKVIPTIHPAATFARRGEGASNSSRAAQYTRLCRADWRRIAADAAFRELRLPQRRHFVKPTLADVRDFSREVAAHATELSLDIETPYERLPFVQTTDGRWVREGTVPDEAVARYKSGAKRGQPKRRLQETYASIGCVGFAYTPEWSLTIPTTLTYWHDREALGAVWAVIRELCESRAEKIAQNGQFDWYWLLTQPELAGMQVRQWRWDTRCMSHALDPTAMHDLATLASLWTREPYYKAESKDPDSLRAFASNSERLWIYNGKDVCVTLEVKRALEAELTQRGMLAFYERHYAAMFVPLLRTALHGIICAEDRRGKRLAELEAAEVAARARIDAAAPGADLLAKKAVSAVRLKKYLYETLALPAQYRKGAKGTGRRVSTDEVALRRLAQRFPEQAGELCGAILAHRNALKEAEFVADGKADADGRLRCMFSLCTNAGRLASMENPRGTGRCLQNIKRGASRAIFLPDGDDVWYAERDAARKERSR